MFTRFKTTITLRLAFAFAATAIATQSKASPLDSSLLDFSRTDLTCNDLQALAQRLTPHDQSTLAQDFQDFQPGDTLEIKIPAEELLEIKFFSGKYVVGQNSSVRLPDGAIIYRNDSRPLTELLINYIKSKYGYHNVWITSNSPPRVDYILRGEVPMQSFLDTGKSRASAESEDLQATKSLAPNSLTEFFKQRRPFTAFSDTSCVAIINPRSAELRFIDYSRLVEDGVEPPFIPILNGSIIYIPQRSVAVDLEKARQFSKSPFAADIQISITGWGSTPKVLSSVSGRSLFDILATSNVLNRGFSNKLSVYRYDPKKKKYNTTDVRYPSQAQAFIPRDKDIVSIGRDPWSASLSTINDLTSPLVTALSTFFFFKGISGF